MTCYICAIHKYEIDCYARFAKETALRSLHSLAMTGDIVILSKAKYPKKHNADNILDISLTLNMTEQSLLIVITKETSFCHDC